MTTQLSRLWLFGIPLTALACARDTQTPVNPAATAERGTQRHAHAVIAAPNDSTAYAMTLVDPGVASRGHVREAIAMLQPTSGSAVAGTVRFVDRGAEGLAMVANVSGLPGGTHAFHVHVYGDCSAIDGKSAGPHFHFSGSSFDQGVPIITGNLGELMPQMGGAGQASATLPDARLHGPYSILGRSVIVHAKGNDPAITPDGGAGDRIACGVIGIAGAEEGAAPQTTKR